MIPECFKLLIVEDNDADFRLAEEHLKESRSVCFEVSRAEDLSGALKAIAKKKFDAAFLDLGLPDSTGLSVIDSISKADPEMALLVLTGLDDTQLGVDALQKGAQDYLVKGKIEGDLLSKSIRFAIERKRSEAAALKAKLEWERTFDSMRDLVAVFDTKHRIVRVNREMARRLSMTPEQCEGLNCYKCVHRSSEPHEFCPHTLTLQDGKEHSVEIHEEGLGGDFLITTTPLVNGQGRVTGSVHVAHDITERRKAERQLEEAHLAAIYDKNRLEAIMETLPVGVTITDTNGGTIQSNAMFEKIWGSPRPPTRTVTDYDKYKAWWVDTGKPVRPEEWASAQVIDTGKPVVGQMMQIERFDGRQAFIVNSAAPIFDPLGKIAGSVVAVLDVTEVRRMEEAIHETALKYQLAIESADLGAWDYDIQSETVFFDQRCRSIFGVTHGDRLPFSNIIERIHPEDRHLFDTKIRRAIFARSMGKYEAEYRVVWADNSVRWVNVRGQVHFRGEGQRRRATRLVGTVMDVTSGKEAEGELQKLNQTLKAISDSRQAMMHATDESSYLDKVCKIIVEVCGYSMVWIGFAEEDTSKTVRPAAQAGFEKGYLKSLNVTWADTDRGRGPTGTAIRTGNPYLCQDMRTDPSFVPWREEAIKRGYASSAVFPLIFIGRTFGALNIYSKEPNAFKEEPVKLLSDLANDLAYGITAIRLREENRHATEALRESKDRLDLAIEVSQLGIWTIDLLDHTVLRSPRHDAIFGYVPMLPDWTFKQFLEHVTPQDRPEVERQFHDAVNNRKEWSAEFRICRADKVIRWVWVKGKIEIDGKRGATHMLGLIQDITDKKNVEEVLRRDKTTFENMVREKTEEILKIQTELDRSKRLSDIGTLAATVAHELRNPLAAIGMAAANIKRKAKNPDLDRHLANIEKKIYESDQIISNLLFYSRIKPPHYEDTDVCEIIDECVEAARQRGNADIKIKTKVNTLKNLLIPVDPLQMKEVFSNILNNACDAVSNGKGLVEIVSVLKDGFVEITVKDDGQGIKPGDLERVFDPFFTTKAKGTGLGLSVCRQIVDFHGGSIQIESKPQKGTTVTVRLPGKQISKEA